MEAMSTLRITVPPPPPIRVVTDAGVAEGHRATDRSLEAAGRALFPRSGEIHYSRLPRSEWPRVLEAAVAGGLTHVATYVLWNHHEPRRGEVSFTGGRDLRAFLELAREAGLGVVLRIGPYAHAEARHGGLPDWLVEAGVPVRTDDPAYLAEARRWYERIAAEVAGIDLFAVQVDNELYDRPEHLATLRRIAEEVGIAAPFWVATGWGAAQLPTDVLPTYGGYPDSFWIEASDAVDHRSLSNFEITPRRDDDGIGADHREEPVQAGRALGTDDRHPFLTCELGGGMVSAYHRRPDVSARDIEALALAKLASGSSWQGYYMYADGRNPRRNLQEQHALGEPNDFIEIGYDFGAPVTVDGAPRESWARLRRQHLLLERWGEEIATMPPVFPDAASGDSSGLACDAWSVRSDGRSGLLFVVDRRPDSDPARPRVAFQIDTVDVSVRFPAVDIPAGARFAWPFGWMLGPARIRSLTAQPVTGVIWRGSPLLVAAITDDVPGLLDVEHADVTPGDALAGGEVLDIVREGATVARVLLVDEATSLLLAVDRGHLVRSPGVVHAGRAVSAREGEAWVLHDDGWRTAGRVTPEVRPLASREVRPAGPPPRPDVAPNGRASIPADWTHAAETSTPLGEVPATGALVIDWRGDVARAWSGERLVSDAIANGRPWRIPAADLADVSEIRVEVLPLASGDHVRIIAGRPGGAAVDAAHWEIPGSVSLP